MAEGVRYRTETPETPAAGLHQQTRLDERSVEHLVSAYRQGSTVEDLVSRFGVPDHGHGWLGALRRSQTQTPTRPRTRRDSAGSSDLHQGRATVAVVARRLKVSQETARLALIEADVTIRGRWDEDRSPGDGVGSHGLPIDSGFCWSRPEGATARGSAAH